jgi:hypothetical protein
VGVGATMCETSDHLELVRRQDPIVVLVDNPRWKQ